ncbi:MAG: protein NirI, partial [Rhodobacteraceae bacterium]|nr:protein NirI [Paracoccaceae bacterium]
MRLLSLLFCLLAAALAPPAPGRAEVAAIPATAIDPATPDPALAEMLFSTPGLALQREAGGVPGWTARKDGVVVGHIGSTWEIAGSVGYSGRPLDVLVAITPDGHIARARLMAHNEPVLTLG